ncbi:MAG: hypothetical protein CMJ18_14655 [Phycisphaeraceae bacterium]|nr:hypothetical protein [Phycisphaeraceae bacterium]
MPVPHYGKTRIVICDDEHDLGGCSGAAVADTMRRTLAQQDEFVMIFAAGESQVTFLDALAVEPDWQRVVCFNMDDFRDTRMQERYSCGWQTRRQRVLSTGIPTTSLPVNIIR